MDSGTERQSPRRDGDIPETDLGAQQALSCVPQALSEPLYLQARHIFLQDIVILTPDSRAISGGHFAKLALMLSSSRNADYLEAAVNAVALASLATRFGVADARSLATAQYITSIQRIRAQAVASKHNTASLVAAISLLSLYEVSRPS